MLEEYEDYEWWNPPNFENEEWAEIIGYWNYLISTFGRVWSWKSERILKPQQDSNYYLSVNLCRYGEVKRVGIHRLVGIAFIPRRPLANDINHIDGDKTYNYVGNLEWVTRKENMQHAIRTELWNPLNSGVDPRPVRIIELNKTFDSVRACARFLNVDHQAINNCLSGRSKTSRGCTFEYVNPELIS